MGKSQRAKGATGEREVCHILRDTLGIEVNRNLSQTRDGGTDIKAGCFNLEVKRRKSIAVYDWVEQAVKSTDGTKQKPVVVCRGDGKEWLAIMRLSDWLLLAGNEL